MPYLVQRAALVPPQCVFWVFVSDLRVWNFFSFRIIQWKLLELASMP